MREEDAIAKENHGASQQEAKCSKQERRDLLTW